ncbi:MAG: hypothetical protein P0120_20575 [Nitrospira sp.]|nr:hypothetical protein [Nitrospira sp.]
MTGTDAEQSRFDCMEREGPTTRDEYAGLVTATRYEILARAQLDRDRAGRSRFSPGRSTTSSPVRCAHGGAGRVSPPPADALSGLPIAAQLDRDLSEAVNVDSALSCIPDTTVPTIPPLHQRPGASP